MTRTRACRSMRALRPARRRRSRLALTLGEREEISRGIAAARSIRSMARLLGRAPSTVSREIKRNGGDIALWLNGYYTGKRGGNTLIDPQSLKAESEKVVMYCLQRPDMPVMQAV